MKIPKHTPEPWYSGHHATEEVQDRHGCLIADFGSVGNARADRDRAVQCVNALAGIDDPATELARLRGVEGAARECWEASEAILFSGYVNEPYGSGEPLRVRARNANVAMGAALSGNTPPDPRDARIAALEGALRPFAEHADHYQIPNEPRLPTSFVGRYFVTVEELRVARATLRGDK
jgi:hypothetical protein